MFEFPISLSLSTYLPHPENLPNVSKVLQRDAILYYVAQGYSRRCILRPSGSDTHAHRFHRAVCVELSAANSQIRSNSLSATSLGLIRTRSYACAKLFAAVLAKWQYTCVSHLDRQQTLKTDPGLMPLTILNDCENIPPHVKAICRLVNNL